MRILAVIVIVLLTGCASVPMAPESASEQAKEFQTPEDQSVIYVFREGTFASGVTFPIWLNGSMSGALAYNTFFRWPADPGEYKIASNMENYAQVELTAEAGEAYFVQVVPRMGWAQPRVNLEKVPPSEAKPIVSNLRMATDQR